MKVVHVRLLTNLLMAGLGYLNKGLAPHNYYHYY